MHQTMPEALALSSRSIFATPKFKNAARNFVQLLRNRNGNDSAACPLAAYRLAREFTGFSCRNSHQM
jgi:hypothetical protein